MTEVFESWADERLQKPQQHFPSPNGLMHLPPRQQVAYYYDSSVAVELPSAPNHMFPASPSLTPNTPLRTHPSPALSQTVPNNPHAYHPPLQGAVEMLVELPDNSYLAAPAPMPVPTRSISTEVSCLRDLDTGG